VGLPSTWRSLLTATGFSFLTIATTDHVFADLEVYVREREAAITVVSSEAARVIMQFFAQGVILQTKTPIPTWTFTPAGRREYALSCASHTKS